MFCRNQWPAPLTPHAILLLYFERDRYHSAQREREREREPGKATDHRLLSVNRSGQNNTGCSHFTKEIHIGGMIGLIGIFLPIIFSLEVLFWPSYNLKKYLVDSV